ncbi:hypothetical protein DFH09DRAFT_1288360 [Mycena vulgaris]|nr:hypothetical protein DFH09DRAFT_1288360 [Mycena vulgaris]
MPNGEIAGSRPLNLVLPCGDVGKNDVETASDKVLPEKAVQDKAPGSVIFLVPGRNRAEAPATATATTESRMVKKPIVIGCPKTTLLLRTITNLLTSLCRLPHPSPVSVAISASLRTNYATPPLATPPTTFIGPVAAAAAISPSLSNSVLLLAGAPVLFRSSPAFTSVTHTAVADSCATAIGRRKVSDAQSKVFVSLFTLIFPIHPFVSRAVAPARYPEGSARAFLPLALSPFNRRQHLAAAHSTTQPHSLSVSVHQNHTLQRNTTPWQARARAISIYPPCARNPSSSPPRMIHGSNILAFTTAANEHMCLSPWVNLPGDSNDLPGEGWGIFRPFPYAVQVMRFPGIPAQSRREEKNNAARSMAGGDPSERPESSASFCKSLVSKRREVVFGIQERRRNSISGRSALSVNANADGFVLTDNPGMNSRDWVNFSRMLRGQLERHHRTRQHGATESLNTHLGILNLSCANFGSFMGPGLSDVIVYAVATPYLAPVHLSRAEFHAKCEEIADAVIGLPVGQTHLLKYELMIPNHDLDAHLQGLGLPAPQGTVIITTEFENNEKLLEFAGDPGFQKIIAGAKEAFGDHVESFLFSVDVVNKVDK